MRDVVVEDGVGGENGGEQKKGERGKKVSGETRERKTSRTLLSPNDDDDEDVGGDDDDDDDVQQQPFREGERE